MTELWLSVRELMIQPKKIKMLDSILLSKLDGIHIDVYAEDDVIDIYNFSFRIIKIIRSMSVDVHFVNDRVDAENISLNISKLTRRIRNTYSTRQNIPDGWSIAASARDIAEGKVDDLVKLRNKILITLPSKSHTESERIRLLRLAIRRIQILSKNICKIVLDRDVDENIANREIREAVGEIVVGKSILCHPVPLQSIDQLRLAWRGI